MGDPGFMQWLGESRFTAMVTFVLQWALLSAAWDSHLVFKKKGGNSVVNGINTTTSVLLYMSLWQHG